MKTENKKEMFYCDNCEWMGEASALKEIQDYWERVEGVVPSGECPECGALAYPNEADPATERDSLLATLKTLNLEMTQARIASRIGKRTEKKRADFLVSQLERMGNISSDAIAKIEGSQNENRD